MQSSETVAASRGRRAGFQSPNVPGDEAAASDGAQSDGAQSESDALNIEVNKEDLLGSVFAKVSGSHTSYLVVVEPPPSCRLKTNQVAAVQFNAWGRAFVAQEHVVVRKSVKSLVTTYCLVHHGLLFTGRQLFCVIDAGEVTEHIIPVVIDGVDAQAQEHSIHWSYTDAAFSSRISSSVITPLIDFMPTVDLQRDVTARFPYDLPAWARLTANDTAALQALAPEFIAQFPQQQPQGPPLVADLTDATEFSVALRQLLAGSPHLPAHPDPARWSAVPAVAVVSAAVTEMAVMSENRFDAALVELQLSLGSEEYVAAAAIHSAFEQGGVLHSLGAWLQAQFSPAMRLAASAAFPQPAERSAVYRKRLRQPAFAQPDASLSPHHRSQSLNSSLQ